MIKQLATALLLAVGWFSASSAQASNVDLTYNLFSSAYTYGVSESDDCQSDSAYAQYYGYYALYFAFYADVLFVPGDAATAQTAMTYLSYAAPYGYTAFLYAFTNNQGVINNNGYQDSNAYLSTFHYYFGSLLAYNLANGTYSLV
jgi:hypothetical protein